MNKSEIYSSEENERTIMILTAIIINTKLMTSTEAIIDDCIYEAEDIFTLVKNRSAKINE